MQQNSTSLDRWVKSFAVMGCLVLGLIGARAAETNHQAHTLEIPGVHNAFRVTEKIYSGSQPEGEAAFAALKKLGVTTILSVDGSTPDVATARKFGLRYVHLPIGYDGVPTNRVVEIAKLTADMTGPVFVHCHHGLHRGPAAVAIMCEAGSGWTPEQASAWLKQAGTSPDYAGLYLSAQNFKAPSAAQLAAIKELPEVTKPSTVVEAMVEIDAHFDFLKQAQKDGWAPPGTNAPPKSKLSGIATNRTERVPLVENESFRKLASQLIEARARLTEEKVALEKLSSLRKEELPAVLPRMRPDPVLAELVSQQNLLEQKLVKMKQDFAPEHPDHKRLQEQLIKVKLKVDLSVTGNMIAFSNQVIASEAGVADLQRRVDVEQKLDAEAQKEARKYFYDSHAPPEKFVGFQRILGMKLATQREATLLWEQYKELARLEETAKRPEDFRTKLAAAEKSAEALRTLLANPADTAALDAAMKQATQSCSACHKAYRN